jgi:Succinyl-CoA synthetase, beta subunit
MNIHEYQAKSILKSFGVSVPEGIVASSVEEARKAVCLLNERIKSETWVVKAQIHAGGRGKGGGVKVAKSVEEVESFAKQILGMRLVTHQLPARERLFIKF